MTQKSCGIYMKKGVVVSEGFKEDIIPNTVYYDPSTNTRYIQESENNKLTSTSGYKPGDYSSIIIKNKTIGVKTQITNVSKSEKITIDGTNQIITSSSNRIFGDDFNWQWLPLQRGKNEISVIAYVGDFTLEWREPMKVGEV